VTELAEDDGALAPSDLRGRAGAGLGADEIMALTRGGA